MNKTIYPWAIANALIAFGTLGVAAVIQDSPSNFFRALSLGLAIAALTVGVLWLKQLWRAHAEQKEAS